MSNTLLDLFATFIGEDINDCIHWEPKLSDGYSDHEVLDAHERRFKLKMASISLLKSIESVNSTDDSGQTFLHRFIEIFLNDFSRLTAPTRTLGMNILENLLDRGASIHITDNKGFSPLQIVMDNRKTEIVQLVLTKLKKICLCYVKNCKDRLSTDTTPLHLNVGDYTVEVLQICLDSGIDFSVHTGSNTTPLILMCQFSSHLTDISDKVYVVDALINRGWDVNAADSKGYSALHYAVEKQSAYIVHCLVELGANVNETTHDLRTPLDLAMQIKSIDKIEVLLKAGASVDAEFFEKIPSIVYEVTEENQLETIQCLIKNGPDIYYRDEILEFESLHLTALNYDPLMFNLILKKQSDVDNKKKRNLTALHLASLTSNLGIVKTLITRGVDVNCRESSYGLTPLHVLSMSRETFDELFEHRDCVSDALTSAVRSILRAFRSNENLYRSSITELLIKNGANVNIRDSRGMTPLHYATLQSPMWLEKYGVSLKLLSAGAQVNRPANDGQLPLHNAIKQRNFVAVGDLLRFGADLSDTETKRLDKSWIPHIHYELNPYLFARDPLEGIYRYIAKLEIAGLIEIDFSTFNDMHAIRRLPDNLLDKHKGEVTKLKNYFIEDRISLYDWLCMNHTKSSPFYLSGVPDELKSQFPVYDEVIQARYRAVTERIPLLEPSKLAWYHITKIDLPEICVECIISHLNNRCLYLLADSVVNTEKLKLVNKK